MLHLGIIGYLKKKAWTILKAKFNIKLVLSIKNRLKNTHSWIVKMKERVQKPCHEVKPKLGLVEKPVRGLLFGL